MANYKPTKTLRIVRPCSESWESMAGDARSRHCESCQRDVVNTAVMTPAEIEAILSKPGPLPCMRMVQFADGSMLAANVTPPRMGLLTRAATVFATVSAIAGSAAAQASRPPVNPTQVALMGMVIDGKGNAVPNAKVYLHDHSKQMWAATTDASGEFTLTTSKEGDYRIDASSLDLISAGTQHLVLHRGGQRLKRPLVIRPGKVFMGDAIEISSDVTPLPTETATVTGTLLPSVPPSFRMGVQLPPKPAARKKS